MDGGTQVLDHPRTKPYRPSTPHTVVLEDACPLKAPDTAEPAGSSSEWPETRAHRDKALSAGESPNPQPVGGDFRPGSDSRI